MNDTLSHIRIHTFRNGDENGVYLIQVNLEELRKLVGNPTELIALDEFTSFMIQGLETSMNESPLVDAVEAATLVNSEHGVSSTVGYQLINARAIVAEYIKERQHEEDLAIEFTQEGDLFKISLTV